MKRDKHAKLIDTLAELERLHIRFQGTCRVAMKGLASGRGELRYLARVMRELLRDAEAEIKQLKE